jgi:hypothetical protein
VDAVENGETGLTSFMLQAGYHVEPIMTKFQIEKQSNQEYWNHCTDANVMISGRYGGASVHPFDTMYINSH